MDEVASNRCFFQNDALLDGRCNKRKRFVHNCQNINYCLPKFPDVKSLCLLRSDHIENNKLISCRYCDCKWSFCDLQDSYLKHYICLPGYTTINKQRHKKQLKAIAVAYQRRINDTSVPYYCIDFGYNMHHHTPSCFKCSNRNFLKALVFNIKIVDSDFHNLREKNHLLDQFRE
jgi:hypothetical protein